MAMSIRSTFLIRLYKQGFFGLFAVFFGRDIEQEFFKGKCWHSVGEHLFKESITNSHTALRPYNFMKHDDADQTKNYQRY